MKQKIKLILYYDRIYPLGSWRSRQFLLYSIFYIERIIFLNVWDEMQLKCKFHQEIKWRIDEIGNYLLESNITENTIFVRHAQRYSGYVGYLELFRVINLRLCDRTYHYLILSYIRMHTNKVSDNYQICNISDSKNVRLYVQLHIIKYNYASPW